MSNAQRYRNRMNQAQEQKQMRDEYHAMEERVAELESERARLRAAIETHRRNVWGDHPIEHEEDRQLYDALQEENDGT